MAEDRLGHDVWCNKSIEGVVASNGIFIKDAVMAWGRLVDTTKVVELMVEAKLANFFSKVRRR